MGGLVHLPSIYRSNGLARAFTMFTNQVNQNANILFELQQTWGMKSKKEKLNDVVFYVVLPTMILHFMSTGGKTPKDDPEGFAKALVSNFTGGFAFANTLINIGTERITNEINKARGGKGKSFSFASFVPPSLSVLEDIKRLIESKSFDKAGLNALQVAAKVKGIPYAQPKRTIKGIKNTIETKDARYLIYSEYTLEDNSIMAIMADRAIGTDKKENAKAYKYFKGLNEKGKEKFKKMLKKRKLEKLRKKKK